MAITYEPIATQTLASNAATIDFTSIPATYTDLKILIVGTGTNGSTPYIQFNNNNTGTNYSYRAFYSANSTPGAVNGSNGSQVPILDSFISGMSDSIPQSGTIDIFSYAGNTNKTFLVTSAVDAPPFTGAIIAQVGIWRSTSAITSIKFTNSSLWLIGTSITIYGIKSA